MTDERPRPRYGEYADPADLPPAPVSPPPPDPATRLPDPAPAGPGADRPGFGPGPGAATTTGAAPTGVRRWDRPVSIALLVFGAINTVLTVPTFPSLGTGLREQYDGLGADFTAVDAANALGTALLVVWGVLLIATIVLTMARLHAGQIAFWIPLVGGVVAHLALFIGVIAVASGDSQFIESVQRLYGL